MRKKIFIYALVSLLCLNSVVLAQAAEKQSAETVKVVAKGLVCEFCARALEKVFLRQEEVASVSVDLTTKDIVIQFKPEMTLDDDTVKKLIRDSGYNTDSIERVIAEIE